MRRAGAGFGGSVVISSVATALLLVAITGAKRPAGPRTAGMPPWPAPSAVAAGVRSAGLQLGAAPGVVTRYVVHLDVLVNGKPVRVPAGIGVDWREHQIAPLYTGDDSGLIYISSDAQAPVFTLGQFFGEWQVPLAVGRLGGLHGAPVTAYVDGARQGGDPGAIVLGPHQEIVVSYGQPGGSIPASYAFPAGW
jgi:hypothetical protein